MDLSQFTKQQLSQLAAMVTSVDSPFYFFTDELDPALVGAAMARFSRNPGDLREILMSEFATDGLGRTISLMEKVIKDYGDDSVQQLVPVQFSAEGVSNLLTKQLEWGRLMGYLEQSTRYIPFDGRDERGHWKFYTPDTLPAGSRIRSLYISSISSIFQKYSDLIGVVQAHVAESKAADRGSMGDTAWANTTRAQALDAVRSILPVATRSSLGVVGNAQTLENLVYHLRSGTLREGHNAADQILAQARQLEYLVPFLQRADMPDRGGDIVRYRSETNAAMRALTQNLLRGHAPQVTSPNSGEPYVKLVNHFPREENSLVPELLFSDAEGWGPLDIEHHLAVQHLSDSDMSNIIQTYMGNRGNRRHKPGRALELSLFEWEIVADYGSFRDLQRHRMVSGWEWQRLTPYHGYQIPQLVTEAGVADEFRSCFEQSEILYDLLGGAGYEEEAQYATLMGHFMRYRFGTNLRELFHMLELRTQPGGHAAYRHICRLMYEELKKVYPAFAEGMIFIDTDGSLEDLARLQSERKAEGLGLR